jgi:hypothetical protein
VPTFAGNVSELNELIAYERDALKFVRTALFGERAPSGEGLELDLTKPKTSDGYYPVVAKAVGHASVTGNAVKSALSQLRPLAFATAFKMHDMIVEWVLRANSCHDWAFKKKIENYKQLVAAGSLSQPSALANWSIGSSGFWKLYESLAPFRNQITHTGSFAIEGNALKITARGGAVLTLSDVAQGAYARFVCLVADRIIEGEQFVGLDALIAENDLFELRAAHALTGITPRGFKFTSIGVIAPARIDDSGRMRVVIDFDSISKRAEQVILPPKDGFTAFDLTITAQADGRTLRWLFPVLSAPTGEHTIVEGDPVHEPYRLV